MRQKSPAKLRFFAPVLASVLLTGLPVSAQAPATSRRTAGVIAGLPEAPIYGVKLRNVKISAQRGLTVAYAHASGLNVAIKASQGPATVKLARAYISLHRKAQGRATEEAATMVAASSTNHFAIPNRRY